MHAIGDTFRWIISGLVAIGGFIIAGMKKDIDSLWKERHEDQKDLHAIVLNIHEKMATKEDLKNLIEAVRSSQHDTARN